VSVTRTLIGEPGAAEPIEREACRTLVKTGIERGHSGDACPLFADLGTTAGDDIVDVARPQGIATGKCAEYGRRPTGNRPKLEHRSNHRELERA
jgi:hypothetical protein